MTTITINERTKAGKALLELAKMLAVTNKGVSIETISGLNKPVAKVKNELFGEITKDLSSKEKTYLANLKKVVTDIKENKDHKGYKTWEEFAREI